MAAEAAGASGVVRLPAAHRPPEPPARGERRFHGQPGHFPRAAIKAPRPPLQGTGTPRPGLGALGHLRRGAGRAWGECAPAPLHPGCTRGHSSEGGSECIGAVGLANPETCLSAAKTNSSAVRASRLRPVASGAIPAQNDLAAGPRAGVATRARPGARRRSIGLTGPPPGRATWRTRSPGTPGSPSP